jgi:hypothetical protein
MARGSGLASLGVNPSALSRGYGIFLRATLFAPVSGFSSLAKQRRIVNHSLICRKS